MYRFVVPIGAALALTMVALGAACTSHGTSDASASAPTMEGDVVDEDAVAIVRAAAHLLRDADSLQVITRIGFDVVQDNGQKLEFGETRKVALQRPDRARFEYSRRDGKQGLVVFDGDDIWVYSQEQNVYAHTAQPGDIDASIEFLIEKLGITTPLEDLFTADVGSKLAEGLLSCYIVGDATISGTPCDHVAARNDYADHQVWIAKGDRPLIQRIVITYRTEPGQPQFWAEFTDWSVGTALDAGLFVFQPPEGSERIFFEGTRAPADTPQSEQE